MAGRRSLLRLSAVLLMITCFAARASEPLVLYTEEYPPFNWTDRTTGSATGLSTDIVVELMRRADTLASVPMLMPWARAMALTSKNTNTCLFSMARTPERETSFAWIGPVGRNEWVMYARAEDHIRLTSLADARPYTVGTIIDDAMIPLLRANQLKLSIVPYNRTNGPKLKMQRIQLWSEGRLPGLYMMEQMGITGVEAVLTFAHYDMYLACNKTMDAYEVARLNTLLRTMYRDGTVRRIYASYGFDNYAPRAEQVAK
ncbi:transporter substrate-binding domain-containing protein [Rugamonas sp. FT103W]|uniref:Transporter substrate-binding domain-containing protein n=2 Tax=Rugamonas rivuli TaxID=2743358 RepID=A0A843SEC3_9BURK|nr:transporter substrate-binding domain-containing protein [Rugamonas rivuli]